MRKNKPSLRGDSSPKQSKNDSSLRDSTQSVESWQSKQNQKINSTLNLFYQICEIPHPSSHTKDLQKFLVDFLKRCDCKVETDSAGNIHALKGAPKLIFQAHYDMVLVGQKVAPFVEGGFLKSRDSSLGADNGIAVALLLDFAKKCKNFEILLTNDEEIGMLGANNLKLKTQSKTMINLDSECVNEICVGCAGGFDADISLADFSEDLGAECLQGAEIYELSAQHFKGGHSGIDIDKNIKNAIVELLWTLESLREKCEFRILEISGGEKRNSIPINAKAVIVSNSPLELHSADLANFGRSQTISLVSRPKFAKNYESQTENPSVVDSAQRAESNNNPSRHSELSQESEESKQNQSRVSATESRPIRGAKNRNQTSSSASADFLLESDKRGSPPKSEKRQLLARRGSGAGGAALLRKETSESIESNFPQIALKKLQNYTPNPTQKPLNSAVIPHLLRLHNGIYKKSGENITSSLNFSLLSNESLKIMVRANSAELLHRHEMRLKSLFGENVKVSSFYNAWEESSESPILRALQGLYDKHKIAHKIVQIHAGLECGILKEKCALREVISIGPTIFHPHSKNEALDLKSVEQIYDILYDLMELEK